MNNPVLRRNTRPVQIGSLTVGGTAPIRVQAMTNTDTADAKATAAQVEQLAHAGAELVRITVNSHDAAADQQHIDFLCLFRVNGSDPHRQSQPQQGSVYFFKHQ